jgi:hypothetical protein
VLRPYRAYIKFRIRLNLLIIDVLSMQFRHNAICLPRDLSEMPGIDRCESARINRDDLHMRTHVLKIKMCATCRGTGKIVVGLSANCMDLAEKVEKCPECGGKGYC